MIEPKFELVEVFVGDIPLVSTDKTRLIVLVELLDLRREPVLREYIVELRVTDGTLARTIQPDDNGHPGYADEDTRTFLESLDLQHHAVIARTLAGLR